MIARKKVELTDSKNIPYDEWLKIVTFEKTELLFSSSEDGIQVAIFRKDNYLILWLADKNPKVTGCSTGVYANGSTVISPGTGSKWVIIETTTKQSNSKKWTDKGVEVSIGVSTEISGQMRGDAWMINPDFHGELAVEYRPNINGKYGETKFFKANWK